MSNDAPAAEIQIIQNGTHIVPFPGGRKRFAAALAALAILDRITAQHSAFADFTDLLNAAGNYRPSLEVPDKKNGRKTRDDHGRAERKVLADVYDECQRSLKDDRRAYRYPAPEKKRTPTYRRKTIQVGEG